MRRYLSLYFRVTLATIAALLLHLVAIALPLYVAAAVFAPAPPPLEALLAVSIIFIATGAPAGALLFAPAYAAVLCLRRAGDAWPLVIGAIAGLAAYLWLGQMPLVLAAFGASVGWLAARVLRLSRL